MGSLGMCFMQPTISLFLGEKFLLRNLACAVVGGLALEIPSLTHSPTALLPEFRFGPSESSLHLAPYSPAASMSPNTWGLDGRYLSRLGCSVRGASDFALPARLTSLSPPLALNLRRPELLWDLHGAEFADLHGVHAHNGDHHPGE